MHTLQMAGSNWAAIVCLSICLIGPCLYGLLLRTRRGQTALNNFSSPKQGLPSKLDYMKGHVSLFFAYWLGARRFCALDGDDFNPEDVQAFHATESMDYLRRNFQRLQSQGDAPQDMQSQQQASEDGVRGPGLAAGQHGDGLEVQRDVDAAGEVGNAGGPGDVAGVPRAARGGGRSSSTSSSEQFKPRFIWAQTCLCFLFWLVACAVKQSSGKANAAFAGLDTISPGSNVLRWASMQCEDSRWEAWRWLTYQFTHASFSDVLSNMVLLFWLGIPLEGFLGPRFTAILFNLGVLGGAAFYFVFAAHWEVVGMSAGVYAFLGVHVGDLLVNWRRRFFRVSIVVFLLWLVVLDVAILGFAELLASGNHAAWVNVGGFLTGVVTAVMAWLSCWTESKCKNLAVYSITPLAIGGWVAFVLSWMALKGAAPINVFEASAGEESWCWFKRASGLGCVRCSDAPCIDLWSGQQTLEVADFATCAAEGWFHDGR